MKIFIFILLPLLSIFFLSCEQAENPLSVDSSKQQINSLNKNAFNETTVMGYLWLTGVLDWGEQGWNPGDRYKIDGLQAEFATDGDLEGVGFLEQYAEYDEYQSGPTHGKIEWTTTWMDEEITLSGSFQGKAYWNESGANILEVNVVMNGECSTGPVISKLTIIGESLGLFEYSGMIKTP